MRKCRSYWPLVFLPMFVAICFLAMPLTEAAAANANTDSLQTTVVKDMATGHQDGTMVTSSREAKIPIVAGNSNSNTNLVQPFLANSALNASDWQQHQRNTAEAWASSDVTLPATLVAATPNPVHRLICPNYAMNREEAVFL